jgi:branched-chain amino acid transport system substrate-binding protein
VSDYKANFKDGFPSPSLFAFLYYISTKAALEGLDAVKGDLSDGQKKYRAALQKLVVKGPAGDIRIDENRNGVGTTYITEVVKNADGSLASKVIKSVPNVSQTLGLSKAEFQKMGLGSRDVPNCP